MLFICKLQKRYSFNGLWITAVTCRMIESIRLESWNCQFMWARINCAAVKRLFVTCTLQAKTFPRASISTRADPSPRGRWLQLMRLEKFREDPSRATDEKQFAGPSLDVPNLGRPPHLRGFSWASSKVTDCALGAELTSGHLLDVY